MFFSCVEIILGVDVPTAEEMAKDALEGGSLIEQSWDDFMAARAASYENLTESDQQFIDNAMRLTAVKLYRIQTAKSVSRFDVFHCFIDK